MICPYCNQYIVETNEIEEMILIVIIIICFIFNVYLFI